MLVMRAVALGTCTVVLCSCGGKTAKPRPEKLIAHQTATGNHASATASADAGRFSAFSVHVSASPNQRVTGGWVISCRGAGSSRDSHDFSGQTPLTARTRPVSPFDPTETCTVLAVASLARSGRVTVKLLGSAQ